MDAQSQDPWTEAQWTRIQETVRDEAKKARVAAAFMPLQGPFEKYVQNAPLQQLRIVGGGGTGPLLQVDDEVTRPLTTLAVNVALRGAQVAQADLEAALVAFRRAANLIARAEDYIVFRGQAGASPPTPGKLQPCHIRGGGRFLGLLPTALMVAQEPVGLPVEKGLVGAISRAVSRLENRGHFGPFAVILGHHLFDAAHSPLGTLIMPSDRIRPLIDGPLLRSSWLNRYAWNGIQVPSGIVVSLADELLDLVVAREISVRPLHVTVAPSVRHVFRVSERITARIKQKTALVALV